MPKLDRVEGAVDVSSTTDISDFCDFFTKADDDGKIAGGAKCTSNNEKANEGEDGGDESSGSSSSDDDDSAAGIMGVNTALLSMALVAGIAQLL